MRKAVSPVIATLLLILIAVAAAVLVYVWVTGYASSITGTGTPELQERIKVEAVSVQDNGNTVVIYVRNIGDTTVTISSIYIIDAASSQVVATDFPDQDLTPGQVQDFKVDDIDPPLEEGKTYIAKAVTENGVEAALSFSYEA